MRGQRSSMKSRSVHRVMEFTFRSWMPTSTYQAYWRACWDRRNGWLLGSVRLAANPEAEPRKRLPESMEDWADDPGSLLRVNVQPGSLIRAARGPRFFYTSGSAKPGWWSAQLAPCLSGQESWRKGPGGTLQQAVPQLLPTPYFSWTRNVGERLPAA